MTPQERKNWVGMMGARRAWWDRRREAIVEPRWEIVDAHVHLWDERDLPDPQEAGACLRTSRYLLPEFLADAESGHRIAQCVYVECGSGYDTAGPAHLRPVGEAEFAAGLADELAARQATAIGAIVAHADLRDPELEQVLEAYRARGRGLVRAVRHSGARLEDPAARLIAGAAPAGLYADPAFRRGVARLGEHGLAFDAFQFHFHFQLGDLAALARAAPGTTIIVNHLGAPVGFAPNCPAGGGGRDPVFDAWARHVEALARLPNVVMKLGGVASIVTGYDGHRRDIPPGSQDFVDERGAYFHRAIRCFGPQRCMFGSNFPVDSVSIGYAVLWNAFKMIAAEYEGPDRRALLAGTARRVYRLA